MIDTVRVKFPVSPTDFQLGGWTCMTTKVKDGIKVKYVYNPVIAETSFRFTYLPEAYDGHPMLSLEFSLPKMSFGHNYQMITNIDEAIKLINSRLDGIPHLPKLDIAEGILIRLDMCYNHQVGDAVDDYIRAIGNLEYPHRRTKYHRNEGAEFRAKYKTTKFYNKEHESGYAEAKGILRQEITLMDAKDIQKIFGIKKPTLMDITKESIVENLKDDLSKIGLLGNSIANRNTALKYLCDTYGNNAGFYYYGLLVSKMDKSKKQIGKDADTHPRSLDRKLRKIVDTGIPLTLTDREEPLPPLTIDL